MQILERALSERNNILFYILMKIPGILRGIVSSVDHVIGILGIALLPHFLCNVQIVLYDVVVIGCAVRKKAVGGLIQGFIVPNILVSLVFQFHIFFRVHFSHFQRFLNFFLLPLTVEFLRVSTVVYRLVQTHKPGMVIVCKERKLFGFQVVCFVGGILAQF